MKARGHDRSADVSLSPGPAAGVGMAGGVSSPGRSLHRWTRELMHDRTKALWLIPLAIVSAYLVVFLARLPHNITELTWDSDYASAFTVPETLARTGTSGHTVIASSGQWVAMWFGLLTARLPLHRQIWMVAPTLLFIATTLIVGWSVAQIATRRAAILAMLLALIASPVALSYFLPANAHPTLYPCTASAGAYLVYLARGQGRRLVTLVLPPLMGIVLGTCVASDLLVVAAVVIPLGIIGVLAGFSREKRSRVLALSALVTAGVAIPVAKLTAGIMHSQGFLLVETPAKAVALSELPERARLLFNGLRMLFNGTYGPGRTDPLSGSVGIVSTFVMSIALLALLLYGGYTAATFIWANLRRDSERTPTRLARSVHVVYWATSAVGVCGAFWVAAETGGGTDLHSSYYATVIFSVAAVIPLLLSSGSLARRLIPIGATIFFAASLIRLPGDYLNIGGAPAATASAIVKAAKANGATYGYGGYGEGSNLTWLTHEQVISRPVMECSNPGGASICPFYIESTPSWYVPRQRRTFLVVNSQEVWVKTLPSGLGKPIASYNFGPISLYVYPYDIASRLGPQQD